MTLESIRNELFMHKTQVLRVSDAGEILETAGDLINVPKPYLGNIWLEDPLLESIYGLLPMAEPLKLPAVSLRLFGREGYYDLEFRPETLQPSVTIIALADLTSEYRQLHTVQQERNENAIRKEWVEINAEKIRLENELLELKNQQLEEMRQFRMDFFARISHEFRTPVNGIVGLAKLLQKTGEDPNRDEYLAALSAAGRHLVALVNDLMDVGKLEAGKLQFEHRSFGLSRIVRSVMAIFAFQVGEKNLKIAYEPAIGLPEQLVGDPMRLSQILFNLIGNAVKFTEKGSITLQIATVAAAQAEPVWLEFVVVDTGIGIEQSAQAKIFELYSQGGLEIARKFGGTGLGLNIVRQLVELQGGIISLESEVGKGTRITFRLPFGLGQIEEGQTANTGARILVVEDNPMNRMVVAELLKQAGFWVESAESGLKAMEVMEKAEFDLVLTDVHMPGMEGPELLKAMRQSAKTWQQQVPVIALTGSSHLGGATEDQLQGFDEMLEKPVAPEMLIRKAVYYTQGIRMAEGMEAIHEPLPQAFNYLASVAGGDRQFMAELIEVFVQETPATMQAMRNAIALSDRQAMSAEAHRYKANLRYVGLNDAQKLTDKIEHWALAGKWAEIVPALDEVERHALKAIPELTHWMELLRKTPNIEGYEHFPENPDR